MDDLEAIQRLPLQLGFVGLLINKQYAVGPSSISDGGNLFFRKRQWPEFAPHFFEEPARGRDILGLPSDSRGRCKRKQGLECSLHWAVSPDDRQYGS